MKIGIDLDDTIWKFHEKFFEFYNLKYGTTHKIEDYNIYDMGLFLNLDKKNILALFDEYESLEKYKILPLMDDVERVLLELNKEHEIYFITARSERTKDIVIERLKKIFLHSNQRVFFTHDENWNKIFEKVDFCLREGIDFMIDDNLKNLELCFNKGIKGILLTHPWNKYIEINFNIIRVNSWKEVEGVLKNERRNGE